MSNIFEEVHKNPSKEKINNGYGLANNKNILKELISINLKNDESEYRWECSEYEKRVYGKAYSEVGLSSRKEIIKNRLWKIPAWRLLIKIYHKIYKRK